MEKKYNVPTDNEIKNYEKRCKKQIDDLEQIVKMCELLLKMNDEGKAEALTELFRMSLETRWTR